jgi:hypothetical protein
MNKMLRWGFTAAYCALMGGVVVMTIPVLEGFRTFILTFILFPIGVAGVGVIAFANVAKVD